MIILFRKSLPTDFDTVHIHPNDDNTPAMHTTCRNPPFDSLEHMEDDPSNEINNNDYSSGTATFQNLVEQVTAENLTLNSSDTFSSIIRDTKLQFFEK